MNVFTSHTSLPHDLGKRLKEARIAIDYTLEELADMGDVTDEEQKSFEEGRAEPTTLYLRRITRTDIDILYVLHGISTQASSADSGDWRVMHAVVEAVELFCHTNHGTPRQVRRQLVEQTYYAFLAAQSKPLDEPSPFGLRSEVERVWKEYFEPPP